ncbi:hypothetical protein JTB14_006295 [Gonioctena quinquepunctata]|nr:hypothetical protein JTB14_006295 [Gonioctena quinquepunctata]
MFTYKKSIEDIQQRKKHFCCIPPGEIQIDILPYPPIKRLHFPGTRQHSSISRSLASDLPPIPEYPRLLPPPARNFPDLDGDDGDRNYAITGVWVTKTLEANGRRKGGGNRAPGIGGVAWQPSSPARRDAGGGETARVLGGEVVRVPKFPGRL